MPRVVTAVTRTMLDGISPLRLPDSGDLYAGYDDGRWPDAGAIAARFGGKRVLRITTDPLDLIGDVLDVERGDARPAQIPGWLTARRSAGAWPSVYCSSSALPTCREAVDAAGIAEPPWWVAAYPGKTVSLTNGIVAHQYASFRGYDVSVVADYWPGVDPEPSTTTTPPQPSQEDLMQLRILGDGRAVVVSRSPANHLLVFTSDGPFSGQPGQQWSVQDVTDQITSQGATTPVLVVG